MSIEDGYCEGGAGEGEGSQSQQGVMAHLHFGCWLLFLFSSHRMLRANAPLLPVSLANKILKYYRRDTIVLYSGWWPVQPVQAAAVRPT